MNKQKFVQILIDQKDIDQGDLESIEALEKSFPYSQVLHILSAIGSYKIKSKNTKQKLSVAAVYSMDRSVLKERVMSVDTPVKEKTSSGKASKVQKSERPVPQESLPATPKQSEPTKPSQPSKVKTDKKQGGTHIVDKPSGHPGHLTSDEAEALRQDVMKNLEDLMLIKQNFMKDQKGATGKQKVKKKPKKISKKKVGKETSGTKSQEKVIGKKISKESNSDTTSKVNIKEQSKIIERFIKEEPVIKKVKKRGKQKDRKDHKENKDQNDLSVESVEFGENLVSENLAKIMVKQGKDGKAIDIYKKLIWKYPQKKAYFASQIESIKQK